MCPRCGKRVYFGKVASRQWVRALGWHIPTVQGLHAGPVGHTEGLGEGVLAQRWGWGAERDVPEEPTGMGPLGGAPGCILSPAVPSQVGGVGFIAVLGHPLSPVGQQRGGRDAGDWGAQGCLGILYAEVMCPRGLLRPRHVCWGAGMTFPPCPRSSREGDFAGEGLAPSLPTLRALQQDADPGGPRRGKDVLAPRSPGIAHGGCWRDMSWLSCAVSCRRGSPCSPEVLGCSCLLGTRGVGEVPSQGDVSWGPAFPHPG